MGILVCFGLLPNPRTPGDHFRRCHRPRNQQPQFPVAALQKRWDPLRASLDVILDQRDADLCRRAGFGRVVGHFHLGKSCALNVGQWPTGVSILTRLSFHGPLSEMLKITGPNLLAPLLSVGRLNNQAVWPVIFGITGPICARALNLKVFVYRPEMPVDSVC
jgi:hypothetical protein